MSEENHCPRCGAALPAQSPQGLCPGCLLKWGLESQAGAEETGSQPGAADRPPPAPEEIAAYFPDLEILELVGRGGMGVVYKARQKRLDRLVALKILAPKVGQDPAFAERFAREARAMAMLSHPHIVAVHDFGQTDGLYYFLMEFVDGVNLRRLLDTGKLVPEETLAVVPQICEALQYAHDHGVVHRDIKPENVLLDKEGRVKIADFGIAKLVGKEAKDLTLTGAGQIMGTPQYMAPEQIEHPLQVDHRADIYSLGVVFYQMLTGELPIGRFAPPSKKVQIDVRLDEVVLRALEKEPEQRYQQASEVKTQVETIAFPESNRIRTRRTPPSASNKEKNAGIAALVLCLSGFPLTLLLAAVAGRNWSVWTFLAMIFAVVLVALICGLVGRKSGAGKAAIAISSLGLFAALAFLGIVLSSEFSEIPSIEPLAPRTGTTEVGYADAALQPRRPSNGEAIGRPVASQHSDRDDRDRQQIVGTWKVVDSSSWDKMFKSVGVAEDGKTATGVPVTKEEAKAAAQRTPMVITQDTLFGSYQYKLDASKNPKAVDVLLNGKVVMLGIYELQGDRLQFHLTKTPQRPTSFAHQPDSNADDIFLVLQRTTAADENATGPARSAGAAQGAKLEALQGKWKVVRVEKGKGGDQAWGRVLQWWGWGRGDWDADPSNTYRFEFQNRDSGGLVIHSRLPQTLIIQFRSDPRATPKTIDFFGTGGGVDALLGFGIYEIEPNRLKICLTGNLPGAQERARRPTGFSVTPDSASVLFVLEPYTPPPEERTVAGTWEIATHIKDGEAVSHAGPPVFRRWTFFGDLVTMNDERRGRFALNPTTQPNEITWAGWEGVNEQTTEQHFNGIYQLDGDRLTIAYRQNGPRPDKFESTPDSGVILLVLERAKANGKSDPNNSTTETP